MGRPLASDSFWTAVGGDFIGEQVGAERSGSGRECCFSSRFDGGGACVVAQLESWSNCEEIFGDTAGASCSRADAGE